MKSTGEVMGVGDTFGEAFVKSQIGAGVKLPRERQGIHQRARRRQAEAVKLAKGFQRSGFPVLATRGTGRRLPRPASPVTMVNKVAEGRPHIVDMIKNGEIVLIVNAVDDKRAVKDSYSIRRRHWRRRSYFTTLAGARAACMGMAQASANSGLSVAVCTSA